MHDCRGRNVGAEAGEVTRPIIGSTSRWQVASHDAPSQLITTRDRKQ